MNSTTLINQYNAGILPFREAFSKADWATAIAKEDIDPKLAFRFFIEQTARGPAMTELVEKWIHRAGEQCVKLGLETRGKYLMEHSTEEANHHQLYIQDTKVLVEEWNRLYPNETLDADKLLNRPLTPGQQKYRDLHDDVAESETPYCQFAIENEIELLSVVAGPGVIQRMKDILGEAVVKKLKFLPHHVLLDAKHSVNNEKEMKELLDEFPETKDTLINTGGAALAAFGTYMDECMMEARQAVVC